MMDRREYFQDYHQKAKATIKRVSLTFSRKEYREVERAASSAEEKPAPFLRKMALQSIRKKTELPPEITQQLADLDRVIRTIANNVNQMAHHSNRIARVLDEQEVFLHIQDLEGQLKEAISRVAKQGGGGR